MAIVVSDTSPVRALNHLGNLDLLRALYGQVYLPDAVAVELRRSSARFPVFEPLHHSFLVIESPLDRGRVQALEKDLDAGEAAALVLALERSADFVLIDERAGRRAARALGLIPVGVLGVLLRAKERSLIVAVQPFVQRLQIELDFRMAPDLIADVLRQAGE